METQVEINTTPVQRPYRSLEEEIAERMLATALYNYHRVFTKSACLSQFKTWDQLTDTEQAFLVDDAITAAIQAVWRGR